jgi:hypothetical protein
VAAFGGLDLCACKRGFFTLRNCANGAVSSCTQCTRRICEEHMAPEHLCVECAAKRDEDVALDEDATGYAVRARHRWYRSGGYDPVYWGTSDPYWHDSDYRWYDDPGDQDDDGGGFGDS